MKFNHYMSTFYLKDTQADPNFQMAMAMSLLDDETVIPDDIYDIPSKRSVDG